MPSFSVGWVWVPAPEWWCPVWVRVPAPRLRFGLLGPREQVARSWRPCCEPECGGVDWLQQNRNKIQERDYLMLTMETSSGNKAGSFKIWGSIFWTSGFPRVDRLLFWIDARAKEKVGWGISPPEFKSFCTENASHLWAQQLRWSLHTWRISHLRWCPNQMWKSDISQWEVCGTIYWFHCRGATATGTFKESGSGRLVLLEFFWDLWFGFSIFLSAAGLPYFLGSWSAWVILAAGILIMLTLWSHGSILGLQTDVNEGSKDRN